MAARASPPTRTPHPLRCLHHAVTGLELRLDPQLDADIVSLLERELDAIAAPLRTWGRFSAPIAVVSADDQDALQQLARAPVDGPLCAAATPTLIALLTPTRWPRPPADHELRIVLCHELAHVLLFQRCGPVERSGAVALPCWFREGMALVASEGRPPTALRRQVAGWSDVPALAEADAALVAGETARVYAAAHVLFDHWHEHHGIRKLGALSRLMRAGAGFERAYVEAMGEASGAWLTETMRQLRRWATDNGDPLRGRP